MKRNVVIVVSGSGKFNDLLTISEVLTPITSRLTDCNVTIREGGARGVDTKAREFAELMKFNIDEVPADWQNLTVYPCIEKTRYDGTKYNALAGMIRNEQMIAKEDVNLVVMFCLNKSPGTRNAYKHAVNYKRNYIYYAIETGEITIGIKGRHYTSMTIEEYKGGCEDWLEHVLKFI